MGRWDIVTRWLSRSTVYFKPLMLQAEFRDSMVSVTFFDRFSMILRSASQRQPSLNRLWMLKDAATRDPGIVAVSHEVMRPKTDKASPCQALVASYHLKPFFHSALHVACRQTCPDDPRFVTLLYRDQPCYQLSISCRINRHY